MWVSCGYGPSRLGVEAVHRQAAASRPRVSSPGSWEASAGSGLFPGLVREAVGPGPHAGPAARGTLRGAPRGPGGDGSVSLARVLGRTRTPDPSGSGCTDFLLCSGSGQRS